MDRLGHLVGDPHAPGGVSAVVRGLLEIAEARGRSDRVVAVPRGAALPVDLAALVASRWSDAGRVLRGQLDGLDGLVVHGVFDPTVSAALVEVRRCRPDLPVASFPHDAYDTGLFESRHALKTTYFSLIERRRLQRCRGIVVSAPSHEDWLRRRGIAVPVHVAPCGLAAADLRRAAKVAARPEPPREDGVVELLYLGRWNVLEKGLDLALSAVAALPRGRAHLRVVGPSVGQQERVRELAAACGDDVELVGWSDDVYADLARADLLLMPSRKEGFGLAGLQALSCGVPVLVSSRAGLAEHVSPAEGAMAALPTPLTVAAGLAAALDDLPRLTAAARDFARVRGPEQTYERLDDALLAALARPRTTA